MSTQLYMAARNNIICNDAKDIESKRASEKEGKKQEKKIGKCSQKIISKKVQFLAVFGARTKLNYCNVFRCLFCSWFACHSIVFVFSLLLAIFSNSSPTIKTNMAKGQLRVGSATCFRPVFLLVSMVYVTFLAACSFCSHLFTDERQVFLYN